MRKSLAHIIGVKVSDINSDNKIATASVIANSLNKRPTTSVMNSNGISTAIKEKVSDTSVNPIWDAPLSADCSGDSPFSR